MALELDEHLEPLLDGPVVRIVGGRVLSVGQKRAHDLLVEVVSGGDRPDELVARMLGGRHPVEVIDVQPSITAEAKLCSHDGRTRGTATPPARWLVVRREWGRFLPWEQKILTGVAGAPASQRAGDDVEDG